MTFCPSCHTLAKKSSSRCVADSCGSVMPSELGNEHFVNFLIKQQLIQLLEEFSNVLYKRLSDSPGDALTDIRDVGMHRRLSKCDLSLTINCDGASIYRSSRDSVWPTYLPLNELL